MTINYPLEEVLEIDAILSSRISAINAVMEKCTNTLELSIYEEKLKKLQSAKKRGELELKRL